MRDDIDKAGLEVKIDAMTISTIEELFKNHYLQLLNYARFFLKDKEESEDIVQGVFYQLLKKQDSIDTSKPLNAYLFTAVRNSCIKRIQHMKIKDRYKENAVHFEDKVSNSTMEKVINNELENELRNAINNLPEQCKLIFTLSRQSGLKYTEIAECLDISVKTVEKQMGKALKVLREKLKNYLPIYV